jgi:hypothetical protein
VKIFPGVLTGFEVVNEADLFERPRRAIHHRSACWNQLPDPRERLSPVRDELRQESALLKCFHRGID